MFCKPAIGVAIAIALSAVACQPLPQPFQPEQSRKSDNPLLDLPDRAGILVRPVDGLPEETSARLTRALADALIRRNIPAFTAAANRESLILYGSLVGNRASKSRDRTALEWRLAGGADENTDARTLMLEIDPGTLAPEDAASLRKFADVAAARIAGMIQNPAVKDRTATLRKRSLHVSPIAGAPAEAGALLRREMENALRRQALRVSSRLLDDAVVVAGSVDLADGDPGTKRVTIDWTVLRADGVELGKLTQRNQLATGKLDGEWPDIARGIATGAADGIRRLLDKIPDTATVIPPAPR